MKLITLTIFAAVIGLSSAATAGAPADSVKKVRVKPDRGYEWAKKQYPWMAYRDTLFCAESEFFWPEGFHRPGTEALTPFQTWISYLPLWHGQRPVGSMAGLAFKPDEVSRPVHFTRWKYVFSDKTIPLEIWAQYYLNQNKKFDFSLTPWVGKPLVYADYLGGSITYNAKGEVVYTPTEKRADTDDEFTGFIEMCDHQTTYKSLAANCDSVSSTDLLPGDMYITWNENGARGKVIMVLTAIVNAKGEKLYVVGTGCDTECDFYIPLFNNDRNYPWISASQIAELFPSSGTAGFFRPRLK